MKIQLDIEDIDEPLYDALLAAFREKAKAQGFDPDAIDAAEPDETVKLPDPVAVLALVDAALVTLSEHDNKAALALLNGLDALVTACRKPLAEGKALSRKD